MWLFCLKIDWSYRRNSSFALTDQWLQLCLWLATTIHFYWSRWTFKSSVQEVILTWKESLGCMTRTETHTHTHRQMCDAADVLISQLSPPQGQRAAPALVFVYSTQTEMRLLWAVGSDLGTGTFACSSPRTSQRLFFFSFKAIGSFF